MQVMPEPIYDKDNLLRRVIFTNPNFVRPDQTVTSFAFTPRKIDGTAESLSVDLERLTTYESSIKDRFSYRLYSLTALQIRNIGLNCEHHPIDGNDAHSLIVGDVSRSKAKQLAGAAKRIHYPD